MNVTKVGSSKVSGTYLVGYVTTTYGKLVATFGEPSLFGGIEDKVQTEWVLEFADGTVATIYDWKTYRESPTTLPYKWHIGGRSDKAVTLVTTALSGR